MSKPPAKSPKDHVAYIHMSFDLWDRVKAAAEAEKRSVTNFIVTTLEKILPGTKG